MSELFDQYRSNYRDVVQSSIDFSGLPHSFFMRSKADLLRDLTARRLGSARPAMLDVGCGARRRSLGAIEAQPLLHDGADPCPVQEDVWLILAFATNILFADGA